jgi:hypothetical protein
MSSKFIPPKVGNRFNCLNEFVDILNIYFYIKTSISAKILNNNALPSITGFEASGPLLPKTAVPFVITATKLPLAVYLYTLLTSFAISKQALPHLVYRLKTNLFVLHISLLELPVFYWSWLRVI